MTWRKQVRNSFAFSLPCFPRFLKLTTLLFFIDLCLWKHNCRQNLKCLAVTYAIACCGLFCLELAGLLWRHCGVSLVMMLCCIAKGTGLCGWNLSHLLCGLDQREIDLGSPNNQTTILKDRLAFLETQQLQTAKTCSWCSRRSHRALWSYRAKPSINIPASLEKDPEPQVRLWSHLPPYLQPASESGSQRLQQSPDADIRRLGANKCGCFNL